MLARALWRALAPREGGGPGGHSAAASGREPVPSVRESRPVVDGDNQRGAEGVVASGSASWRIIELLGDCGSARDSAAKVVGAWAMIESLLARLGEAVPYTVAARL